MGHYFSFPEVFPIIEKILVDHSGTSADYMRHNEIVTAIMSDDEGSKVLNRLPQEHSPFWWANNMVAWFSQFRTVSPHYRSRFERKKIDGKWAYKLATQEASLRTDETTSVTA
jgi:hypothetical protein